MGQHGLDQLTGDFSVNLKEKKVVTVFSIDVNSPDFILQNNDDPAALELQSTSVRSLSLLILMDIYSVLIIMDVRLIFCQLSCDSYNTST